MRTLFSQITYIIILFINILLIAGLVYVHQKICIATDEKEQQIAWQTLNNTVEKADFFFDRSEMACVETAKFAPLLEKDTALLYKTLTELLQDNNNLRAAFICFCDSVHQQNAYLIQDKNHITRASFNDYISELKQKSLQNHFEQNPLKPYWERSVISLTENQAYIHLFVPFSTSSSRMKGFVGFNINLATIDTLLRSALTCYEKDDHAFIFMLTPDGTAVAVAGEVFEKNENLFNISEHADDNPFLSMLYNMRNGETASVELKIPVIKTNNMVFYKSLTNNGISIALSYCENQSTNAWKRLFMISMGALIFFFGITTLWLWHYWRKRAQMIDKIEQSLSEIGKGSTTAVLPSSMLHQDLEQLCYRINNMQRKLDQINKKLVFDAETDERKNNERKLAKYIRQYFYSPVFQFYDTSVAHKIRQNIKTSYLPDVGGDFHDYFSISPQYLCFVTGTVSRPKKNISNIQTAIDILMTMNLIRSHLKAYSSLGKSIFYLNNDLCLQNNGNFTVNIFMGVLNCETGILEFVSAGAPALYMISHRNIFSLPVQHGAPLASKRDEEYAIGTKELFNGDMLLIHTAGVLSNQNAFSDKYGELRLQKIMSDASKMNPDMFLEEIVKDISKFTEQQPVQMNDYTLLAIKYAGL